MLLVYLCDDIKEQLENHKEIINRFLLFKDWDMKLICASTQPYELLQNIEMNSDMGLYFLDVDLKNDIDGFKLAEKIRQHDPRGFIVFVTTHSEYSHIPYECNMEAMNYILKDDPKRMKAQIEKCLQNAYERYKSASLNTDTFLSLKSAGSTTFIKKSDIICIQASCIPHQIDIYKTNGVVSVYEKLNTMEGSLNEHFFRIHKSSIINMEHIDEIIHNTKSVKMDDGSVIAASAPKLRALIKLKTN